MYWGAIVAHRRSTYFVSMDGYRVKVQADTENKNLRSFFIFCCGVVRGGRKGCMGSAHPRKIGEEQNEIHFELPYFSESRTFLYILYTESFKNRITLV